MIHRFRVRPVSTALLLLAATPSLTQAITATVVADTAANAILRDTNLGRAQRIQVNAQSQAFLQFDLSALPADVASTQIARATLVFYVNAVRTPGAIEVAPVPNDWREAGLTSSNAPASGAPVERGKRIRASDRRSFSLVDVTELVQANLDTSTGKLSLRLAPDNSAPGAAFSLDSKENTRGGHSAYLEIVLSGSAPTDAIVPSVSTILSGSVPPSGQGNNGDFYIDTVAGVLYGPRASGNWPTGGLSLVGKPGPAGPAGAVGPSGPAGLIGPAGPAGADGLQGATGPAGPTGSQGPVGATGPAGPQGPAGAAGKTVLNGPTDPTNEGTDGDFYLNTATNTLFGPKAAGAWPNVGVNLKGPAGTAGATGPVGPRGSVGPAGPVGAVGPVGPAGPIGPAGPAGAAGAAGANGQAGAQGPAGPVGPQGPVGAAGKTVLNGATDPTNEGTDGDFFLNTATSTLFGPKAAGAWPNAGVDLKGPAGAAGVAGPAGPQGPAGAIGPVGPAGAAGVAGAVGPVGPQGPAGQAGAVGPIGPRGPAGPQGPVGAAGPAGTPGAIGPAGPQGATGAQGPAGTNGANGTNGFNAAVRTSAEAAGANCAAGGIRVEAGTDSNRNNTLDTTEVNAALTRFVCNGTGGGSGAFGTNTGRAAAGRGADCTLGQVILTAGFVAVGLPADGRTLLISQNTALFALLGTNYGGDGRTTFNLPDLRSAAPNGLTYTICDQGLFPARL